MPKPLTAYERWVIEEREATGEAAEDERRIRETIAIDDAAIAAALAREAAYRKSMDLYGVDDPETRLEHPYMKAWLDEAGQ